MIKSVTETIQNEATEHKGVFLGMLLSILGASLLGNLLTGKDTELVKTQLELFKIFNATSSFNQF